MAQEADAKQMQESWPTRAAHVFRGGHGCVVSASDVRPVGAEVAHVPTRRTSCLDPIGRSADADAKSVVLAAKQQWHAQSLVRCVFRGVQRAERGRVV